MRGIIENKMLGHFVHRYYSGEIHDFSHAWAGNYQIILSMRPIPPTKKRCNQKLGDCSVSKALDLLSKFP